MKKFRLLLPLAVFFFSPGFSLFSQLITSHDALFMPELAQPSVGNAVTDPVFGTQIRRLTNASAAGNLGTVPHYSKRQAWNANDSLMMLYNADDGYFDLYDGRTYLFIRPLLDPVIGGEDVFWHPVQKNVIIYVADNILYSYNLATNEVKELHVFSGYSWVNTRGEGNLSNDGAYYACIGQDYVNEEVIFKDILVLGIYQGQVVSQMAVSNSPGSGNIDWMSISPSGNYVVIDYSDEETGRYHGVEVYERSMNFLWQYPAGAGHSDLGFDENGDEVIVKDYYNVETNTYFIRKYRLSDGALTDLLELPESYDMHISLRNSNRPGWCYISTFDSPGRLTDNQATWMPFEDEIFALKTDGSGDVQRIAHHHSRRYSPQTPDGDQSVYWAEPHATVNRAGTKVIWGSNWRKNMDQVTAVDVYLCDISQYVGVNEDEDGPRANRGLFIYPNPASDHITVNLNLSGNDEIHIIITDLAGKTIKTGDFCEIHADNRLNIDISGLKCGIYEVLVQSGTSTWNGRFIKSDG